jgi:hypothetical protein
MWMDTVALSVWMESVVFTLYFIIIIIIITKLRRHSYKLTSGRVSYTPGGSVGKWLVCVMKNSPLSCNDANP